jgi:hypothetical protein
LAAYITVPGKYSEPDGYQESNSYGFYFDTDALVLQWKGENEFMYYPWELVYHSYYEQVEYQNISKLPHAIPEVRWVKIEDTQDTLISGSYHKSTNGPHGQLAKKYNFPYTYTLNSGKIQYRTATVYVCRREWRRRWLGFTSLFSHGETCIDVQFNEEVGERSGSWKGGVTGCSYKMLPGETSKMTLERMEKERKF